MCCNVNTRIVIIIQICKIIFVIKVHLHQEMHLAILGLKREYTMQKLQDETMKRQLKIRNPSTLKSPCLFFLQVHNSVLGKEGF